jgi:uncharacterized protein YoxC
MDSPNLMLIIACEVLAIAVIAVAVLVFQNRKLRGVMKKLQERMHELVEDLKKARAEPRKKTDASDTYIQNITQHIELTKKHHTSLRGGQDIALDLDPQVPLPRRTAALRHAILIAEKESHAQIQDKTNWDLLAARYQQLLAFNKDYDGAGADTADIEALREELATTRKRVANLEKFKTLYFDLEKTWRESKGKASEYFDEMTHLISEGKPSAELAEILQNYHGAFSGFNDQIEAGIEINPSGHDENTNKELLRLRNVTVDQHRIINDLQDKLAKSSNEEQRASIIRDLQTELQKQARYMQESETCIKLMEEELKNANKELEQLRARTNQLNQIRKRLKDLQSSEDANQHIIQSLKQDNRRLAQKLKTLAESAPEDSTETRAMRRELSALKSKYAELEERYLDLKLQG